MVREVGELDFEAEKKNNCGCLSSSASVFSLHRTYSNSLEALNLSSEKIRSASSSFKIGKDVSGEERNDQWELILLLFHEH